MHRSFPCLALAGFVSLQAISATAPESLFNGKDLSGWVPMHGVQFEAHEGALRLVRGMGWLRTENEYGDFVLEMELRPLVERYDTGLYFRAGVEGKPWPTNSWQVNFRRDMWGALVRGFTRVIPSSVEGPDVEETGPWTQVRLEVRGAKATLDLDGKRLWETDKVDRPRGHIGIQAEERAFDFRNLRIHVLDTPPAKI